MTKYEAVIGLETHIQLNTLTKIFCGCKADSWGVNPNTNICPVCSGYPGVLPVLNNAAVDKAILLAAAMHAEILSPSYFDRKNYFYPDLPKGFQITQFDQPIGMGGYLEFSMPDGYTRKIRIHKLHLEEDAGKTKVENGKRYIDFNRCGVPLVEMVTEPDIKTAEEAAQYLIRLRQLLRWIKVSEADMEKGHLRCDANVSIREVGSNILNPKTEIKNVNSIDAVQNAINIEIKRQIKEVINGGHIESWTLDWDNDRGVLNKMRSKETEADYRYFREPDLLPLHLSSKRISDIVADLPELPLVRKQRFMDVYRLPQYDAEILTSERSLSEYFESAVRHYGGEPKIVSNWIINDLLRMIKDINLSPELLNLTPVYLADIIKMVEDGFVNTTTAKNLFSLVQKSNNSPREIVEKENLGLVRNENSIKLIVEKILNAHPEEVQSYKSGRENLLGWFLGQVMRETAGKADPKVARRILINELTNR